MARVAAGPSSEERRQQIIAAARCVFARKGFMGATNKDIALAAGITPGLLYHYFADKRALFEAVLMEHTPLGDVSALLADEGVQQLAPRELLLTLLRVMVTGVKAAENVAPSSASSARPCTSRRRVRCSMPRRRAWWRRWRAICAARWSVSGCGHWIRPSRRNSSSAVCWPASCGARLPRTRP